VIDRDRLHSGFSASRLIVEARRAVLPLIVLLMGGVVGLACWFILVKNVGKQVYTATRDVNFAIANADAVVPGRQEVRFKGIPAGLISAVRVSHGEVLLTAEIYRSFGPIYRNAQAVLRPNTALQDMYLDITNRGAANAGTASTADPVPLGQTQISVQPADVLQAFDPDVRSHLATVLSQLGGGLQGRGVALRSAFAQVAPFLHVAGRLSNQLVERSALTKQLIHDTAILTGDLGARQTELRNFVEQAASTLKTLNDGSGDLGATLTEIPPTLARLQRSLVVVRDALPDVNNALTALEPVAMQLPAGLAAVRRLSNAADPAVRALQTPVQRLVPLARALQPVSSSLDRALEALQPQLGDLDHLTHGTARCMVPLEGFFQFTPSLMKIGDSRETGIRADLTVDLGSSGVISDPNVHPLSSCAAGRALGGMPGLTLNGAP
jgi:ABC-type transporter Mla subunit MlaD